VAEEIFGEPAQKFGERADPTGKLAGFSGLNLNE
jgi:hypothetical protein